MSEFLEIPNEILNIDSKEINQIKLNLDIDDFYNNDIVLISSGTATGKTKNVARLCKDLKSKYNCNILSIVNLISLSREQIRTFDEESEIILSDYQTDINKFCKTDGVICLNSLYKLRGVENFNMDNTILYIDEINDLIQTLTNNDSLDKVLNTVYTFLIQLIKNCKKIILSDATINQNTLNFISSRTQNNKAIMIKNINKKFSGIDATRYKNENEFFDKVKKHIEDKKYFLFGCDSCKKITTIYSNMIQDFESQKEDFILITSETKFQIIDPSKQFKNKYVFYSPSITTGVSFVLDDIKQTQFIYISDKPLITPISIYQMSSRTRNLNELNYYCAEIKAKKQEYQTIKEVENKYKKMIKINEKVLSMSKSINENDEIKIIENTYFKLFCYNEFLESFYNTGFLQHYQNILKNNGFNLKDIGETKKMNFNEKKEYNEIYETIKEEELNEFLDSTYNELNDEEDIKKYEEVQYKHSILKSRLTLLNIPKREDAEKYKMFISDEYALKNYFNFITLLRTDEYIKNKNVEKLSQTFKIKNLSNVYNKLSLLDQLEKHYNITRFNFNFDEINVENEISKKYQTLCKDIFRSTKTINYKIKYELLKVYVQMIKNICGDLQIISSKQVKKKKNKEWQYSMNTETLKDLVKLVKFNNPSFKNFNIELIEKLTGIKPEEESKVLTKDEDELINYYLFQKSNFKKII